MFLFLGLYFSTLLGFTFVFILIQGEEFSAKPQTFVRTVAMMVGELEYKDTFGSQNIIINTIVFIFVIVIPIVINNLLIGLTVDDVQELTRDACLKGLESKIKAISVIDKSFLGKVFSKLAILYLPYINVFSVKIVARFGYSRIIEKNQEVCIHPSVRHKPFSSQVDITKVQFSFCL